MTRPNNVTKSVANTHDSFKADNIRIVIKWVIPLKVTEKRAVPETDSIFPLAISTMLDRVRSTLHSPVAKSGTFSEPKKVFDDLVSTNEWNVAPLSSISRYDRGVMSGFEQKSRLLRTSESQPILYLKMVAIQNLYHSTFYLRQEMASELTWGILLDSGSQRTLELPSSTSRWLSTL